MKFPPNKTTPLVLIFSTLAVAIVFSACEAVTPVTPVATVATAIPATIEYPPPAFVASQDCEELQHGMLPLANLTISFGGTRDITVQVEVADETGERSQGLMCRESIPAGTGMLFTYDSDWSSGFWMFNTYAPIDILYLDQSGRVVDNIAMSPCTRGTNDDDEWRVRCATEANDYVPSGAWRNVLELPAGWLETQGFGGLAGQEIEVSWTSAAP